MDKENLQENQDKPWYPKAAKLLKGEMLRLGYSVPELARQLEITHGIKTSLNALGKKINKGGFSLAFFIQCMEAMGITQIDLYNTRPPESKHAPELGTRSGGKPKLIDDEIPPYKRSGVREGSEE